MANRMEQREKDLREYLREGEVVRWESAPHRIVLMDEDNKSAIIRRWILTVVITAAILIGYVGFLEAKTEIVILVAAIALYNLLANALHVTPPDGDISLSLYDDGAFFTITVADRGPGLDAARFEALLSGWQMPAPLDEYLALARQGTPPGLGLPLIQRIAQLHGGSLLLSPREGGGSQLHFTIAHLPESLADHNLHAPMILEDGYPLEEIEFSILD